MAALFCKEMDLTSNGGGRTGSTLTRRAITLTGVRVTVTVNRFPDSNFFLHPNGFRCEQPCLRQERRGLVL